MENWKNLQVDNKMSKCSHFPQETTSNKAPVQPFYLKIEVTETTDASEKAIDGVLSQEGHPVIYLSRKWWAVESRYCNF